MPGIGVRTGARILIDVGDGSAFPTASHLAAYTGLAHATRRSGSSIRGESPYRRGNKHLKRAFFLSAFAALADPRPRTPRNRGQLSARYVGFEGVRRTSTTGGPSESQLKPHVTPSAEVSTAYPA
jgi:transposase